MKKIIIFDLDGTLTQSKSVIDAETANLMNQLLQITKVAVISGGNWQQFQNQLLKNSAANQFLKNLILLPTSGTQLYQYQNDWQLMYSENFNLNEKNKIINALNYTINKEKLNSEKVWGQLIEDRGSQITFSGLGQKAPIAEKLKWDSDLTKRKKMKVILDAMLPDFSVRLGGTTSIDITKIGIDKAYGINKIVKILEIPIDEMLFIGDALYEDGNDFPVKKTGISTLQVENFKETKLVIKTIIACLN